MKAVGVRELKNRLSQYLRLVRNGETVLVTDRGAIVAELGPPGASRLEAANPTLDALMRRGNVTIGAPNRADLYSLQTPVAKRGLAAELLDAERDER